MADFKAFYQLIPDSLIYKKTKSLKTDNRHKLPIGKQYKDTGKEINLCHTHPASQ